MKETKRTESPLKHFVVLEQSGVLNRLFQSEIGRKLFGFAYEHYNCRAIRAEDRNRIVNTLKSVAEQYRSGSNARRELVRLTTGRGGYFFIHCLGFKLVLHPLTILPACSSAE